MMVRLLALAGCVLVACATAGNGQSPSDGPPAGSDGADAGSDANSCTTQPCDILPQCGCATNQSCDIDSTDLMGTACRTVSAPNGEGKKCSTAGQCDIGLVCLGGFCAKYCGSNADCAGPRGQCVIDIQANGVVIPGIPSACTSGCDPTNVAAGGCDTGAKCGLFTTTHNGVQSDIVACTTAGAGVQGTVCTGGGMGDDALCGPDFACTTLNGTSFNCRKVCVVNGNGCGVLTCLGFGTPLIVGGTEYGVCN